MRNLLQDLRYATRTRSRTPGFTVVAWDTYMPLFDRIGISPPELEGLERQTDLLEQSAAMQIPLRHFYFAGSSRT